MSIENTSLRKSIEENAKSSRKVEIEMKNKLREAEEALVEPERLATNATKAAKLLREELDKKLDDNNWLGKEIISNHLNLLLPLCLRWVQLSPDLFICFCRSLRVSSFASKQGTW